jgi:hypothetical protein
VLLTVSIRSIPAVADSAVEAGGITRATMASAILRDASSIISSPSVTAPGWSTVVACAQAWMIATARELSAADGANARSAAPIWLVLNFRTRPNFRPVILNPTGEVAFG